MKTIGSIKVEVCDKCGSVDFQDGQGFLKSSILVRARVRKIRAGKVENKEILDIPMCGTCYSNVR